MDTPKGFQWTIPAPIIHVMGHTFNCAIGAAVISARHSCACHQAHIVHLIQLRNHIGRPIRGWFATDLIRFAIQAAAHAEIFIRKDHVQSRLRQLIGGP